MALIHGVLMRDITRCFGEGCCERETCQRYRQRNTGIDDDLTPFMAASASIADGARCLDRIPVEPRS